MSKLNFEEQEDKRFFDKLQARTALAHTGQAAPAGEVASEPLQFNTSDNELTILLELTADMAQGRANMDTGIWWHNTLLRVQSRLATPATEPAAPGYVSVPVVPTRAMQDAWDSAPFSENLDVEFRSAYQAMLAAASTVQGKEKP